MSSTRLLLALLVSLAAMLTACGDDNAANTGNEVVEACSDIECPIGTTRYQDSSAEGQCSGSGSVNVFTESGEVKAQCTGSGECLIICMPPEPCCEGEKWTSDSYECEKICAASCTCDGKCGTVTGVDCEADCGGCEGGELCSADNLCVAECAGGVASCGGDCCATGEACYQNLCCDKVENCKGLSCGTDGCGGLCKDQESVPGCADNEVCGQDGQCTPSCVGELPICSVQFGEEIVMKCDNAAGVFIWVDGENCTAIDLHCDVGPAGAYCAGCGEDEHCDDDDPCTEGDACVTGTCVETTPKDCDDGVFCNGVESCDPEAFDGCVPGSPVDVDDAVDCTDDLCDEDGDTVTHTPNPSLCEDDEPCTDNGCLVDSGCDFVSLTDSDCDDGSVCTLGDTCSDAGACIPGGTSLACDDENLCTTDTCDPVDGCLHVDNTEDCADGLTCTVGDACEDGACMSGPITGLSEVYDDAEASLGGGPIASTSDDGLAFTTRGLAALGNGNESFVIRKLDPYGQESWKTPFDLYPDGAWAHGIATLPTDDGFVVVGHANSGGETIGFVAIVSDADGEITLSWTSNGACEFAPCAFTAGDVLFDAVDVAPDGSIAVVGSISTGNTGAGPPAVGIFVKLDSELNVQKTLEMTACMAGPNGHGVHLQGIRYLDDNTPDAGGEGWVLVGRSYWHYPNENPNAMGSYPHPCGPGGYCLGGPYRGLVARMSMNGAITQCTTPYYTLKDGTVGSSSEASITSIRDVIVAPAIEGGPEAGYILVGMAQGTPALSTNYYGWAARYNNTFTTMIWNRLYGPAPLNVTDHPDLDPEPGLAMTTHKLENIVTIDGQAGFYLSGYVRHVETAVDTWLLRIDGDGEIIFDQAYGAKEEAWTGPMTGLSNGVAIVSRLLDNFTYSVYGASLIRTDVDGEVCQED